MNVAIVDTQINTLVWDALGMYATVDAMTS